MNRLSKKPLSFNPSISSNFSARAFSRALIFVLSCGLIAAAPTIGAESTNDLLSKPIVPAAEKGVLGTRDPAGKPSLERAAKAPKSSGTPSQKLESATEITAQKRLVYDPKESKAIFTGDVVVVDPRFNLNCEILTAFIKKTDQKSRSPLAAVGAEKAPQKPEAPGAAETAGSAPAAPKNSGGLERAIAEGEVVIVQERVNDQGEVERSVGRAQKAVYESSTDTIALSGWPRVDQEHKRNSIVATSAETVMTMTKKGDVDIQGPMKAVFWNSSSASR
jgi:lipopolysaccharide export system protein LptA